MKLSRFIYSVIFITIICIIYVQLQIQIFELAYNGKKREATFKELLDRRAVMMYNINKLESAHNIGTSLLSRDSNLVFTDKTQIVKLDLPIQLAGILNTEPKLENKRPNWLSNFFSLKSEAQAKPIK
ncbi:MAG: hypothetical protein Q8O13_04825 [Candidatus Omnitrophota bacterium]|nr:hypothetical protein [Candidatus Omnitrophota bacterium]